MEEIEQEQITYHYRQFDWYDWRSTAYEPVLSLPGIDLHAHVIWMLVPTIFPYTRPMALPLTVVAIIVLVIISKKDLTVRNAWPRFRSYLVAKSGIRRRRRTHNEYLRKKYQ